MPNHPVILVHGIQGSWLKDQYPVDYQDSILWTGILKKNFAALHLHALDSTVDAEPKRMVFPHQAVPLIYESLVDEVRDELAEQHPYVYMFTYDWRKDNRQAAEELGRFMDRVLRIAAVHERAAGRTAPRKVSLIGHSMGGLVIKWYATQLLGPTRAKQTIERILTIATPFGGSLKAVEALLPGARNLFGMENQKSMRHAARTMPGLYQLLPAWKEAVVRLNDHEPLDVFDEKSWQENLVAALKERFGTPAFFRNMLADAKKFSAVVSKPWPAALRGRVWTAFGVETDTWWQVPVDTSRQNFFHFDKVRYGGAVENWREGDGTVHVTSSYDSTLARTHRFSDKEEFKDKLAGHHANMPNHGGVQDWVLGVLKLNEHVDAAFDSPR